MISARLTLIPLALVLLSGCAASQTARFTVDATDLPRHLLHAEMAIPVGEFARDDRGGADIWFVEWVPGNHNPSGPVQNLVNFSARDDKGRVIEWRRDPARTVRKTLDIPPDAREVRLRYSYIASQPWVNSRSSDSYGRPNLGVINFNTVLFYPGGANKNEFLIDGVLLMPDGWSASTSLLAPGRVYRGSRDGGVERVGLGVAPLAIFVDAPAIMGEHLASWAMSPMNGAVHTFDAVAPSEEFLVMPPERMEKFNRMHAECEAVFGAFPFGQFRYLIAMSDDLPGFGVEHRESTLIRYPSRTLCDSEKPGGSPMGTVPHEYVHVWVGKLVAQEGLLHENYHTPADTRLMWVYEGLTTYYTDVMSVRSGLLTFEQFRDALVERMHRYAMQPGRAWRSVEDTAAGLRHLRETSPRFENLRRRQDYYHEGSLFWLEADALIRGATNNERSLDDFSRAFFGVKAPPGAGDVVEHTRQDVVDALRAVYAGVDWDAMIRERIESPRRDLGFDTLARALSSRFEYTGEPFTRADRVSVVSRAADLRASIGVSVRDGGEIGEILLDSPAWRAGLGYDMTIVGVGAPGHDDHVEYSAQSLRDAVAATPERGGVDLLVKWDGQIRPVRVAYDGGMRYPRLVPVDGGPDILGSIATPRTE